MTAPPQKTPEMMMVLSAFEIGRMLAETNATPAEIDRIADLGKRTLMRRLRELHGVDPLQALKLGVEFCHLVRANHRDFVAYRHDMPEL